LEQDRHLTQFVTEQVLADPLRTNQPNDAICTGKPMMDHSSMMLTRHLKRHSDDLAANRPIRCLDDLGEHGVVPGLHKHLYDRVNDGRQVAPPECKQVDYEGEASKEMRQVGSHQPLADRRLSLISDNADPIILPDQQVA